MVELSDVTGFDWDEGNLDKNWINHQVSFYNLPLLFQPDTVHSTTESRYFVLGQTDAGRKLFIAFTVRENKIRVISGRDMSKKERTIYEKTITWF